MKNIIKIASNKLRMQRKTFVSLVLKFCFYFKNKIVIFKNFQQNKCASYIRITKFNYWKQHHSA